MKVGFADHFEVTVTKWMNWALIETVITLAYVQDINNFLREPTWKRVVSYSISFWGTYIIVLFVNYLKPHPPCCWGWRVRHPHTTQMFSGPQYRLRRRSQDHSRTLLPHGPTTNTRLHWDGHGRKPCLWAATYERPYVGYGLWWYFLYIRGLKHSLFEADKISKHHNTKIYCTSEGNRGYDVCSGHYQ